MRKGLCLGILSLIALAASPAWADQYSQQIKIYRSKAVEAQFLGNADEALDNYQHALQIASGVYGANSPYLAEIYYDMGSLCLANSNFNKAEGYLNQTIKLNPNSTAAHLRLAELMRIKGRAEEAQKHARLVVAKHRDDVVARQELALAYERNEPPDNIRAYREYSALEQLIRRDQERYAGREPANFVLPGISLPVFNQAKPEEAPAKATVPPQPKKVEPDAKKQAEISKKAAAEAKKAADMEKKKLEQARKKAEQESKKAELENRKKLEQEKKKAEAAKKKPATKPQSGTLETETMSGLPANLRGKAVLLTPVKKNKPVQAESTSSIVVPVVKKVPPKPAVEVETDAGETESDSAPVVPPKKASPAKSLEVKKAGTPKPKPGKHAPGLVPPPPPVIPTMQMMPLPQVVPQKPAAKVAPTPAPKKEEKPKETSAPKDEGKGGGADEDDFLLDWGGAKNKKK